MKKEIYVIKPDREKSLNSRERRRDMDSEFIQEMKKIENMYSEEILSFAQSRQEIGFEPIGEKIEDMLFILEDVAIMHKVFKLIGWDVFRKIAFKGEYGHEKADILIRFANILNRYEEDENIGLDPEIKVRFDIGLDELEKSLPTLKVVK
jgi:hypothetical protein